VIVVGAPGVGKTTLVRAYVAEHGSRFERVVAVKGERFESVRSLLEFVLSELGDPSPTHPASFGTRHVPELIERLRAHSGRPLLVVIDDIDQVGRASGGSNELLLALHGVQRDGSLIRWLLTARTSHAEAARVPLTKAPAHANLFRLQGFTEDEVWAYLQQTFRDVRWDRKIQDSLATLSTRRLDGNPALLRLLVQTLALRSDFGPAVERIEDEIAAGLTNLLVVRDRESLRAIPVQRAKIQRVRTPSHLVLPVAPYIWIPRHAHYWADQLDEFEALLNDPRARESQFQAFFERYPHFLTGVDYRQAVPHPILERDGGEGPLIPDFFLQPNSACFADILDVKLPVHKLISGRKDRERYSSAVTEAIAQVREYASYFDDPARRRRVLEKYKMTAYKPTLIVIIGRTPKVPSEEKVQRIRLGAETERVRIVTYDELFLRMERLVELGRLK
jgi:type II secretory pathway predicted ATPase ExeA